MLAFLIIAHLIGDFLLQNHWMQDKAKSTFVCLCHIAAYSMPFFVLSAAHIVPAWMVFAILIQHFLQDRFQLHIKWMRLYHHTTPDKWPVGPLCVDQAMHLAFVGALCLIP